MIQRQSFLARIALGMALGIVGGPWLWALMLSSHKHRAYSLGEHIVGVLALGVTFYMFVSLLRELGLNVCAFASYNNAPAERAAGASGLTAAGILLVQLGFISVLPLFLAAAGALLALGAGYAILAWWAGRGGRERWLPAAIFAASIVFAYFGVYYLHYRLSGGSPLFLK